MFPFLHELVSSSGQDVLLRWGFQRSAHPSQPGTAVGSKRQVPGWLKGLEVLVRLEEGPAGAESVYETKHSQTRKHMS